MTAALHAAGRIGPNAIIRVAEVMPGLAGDDATQRLFAGVGLLHYLQQPPEAMVLESEVRRLHQALPEQLGSAAARTVALAAGERTAEYLLAHRIPRPVQTLLKALPAPLAARVLLAAIRRNAWTFVGSGQFSAEAGHPVRLHIRGNPLCQGLQAESPACHFYAATFERLFVVLVHPGARVQEVACQACGDAECRFEIRWRA